MTIALDELARRVREASGLVVDGPRATALRGAVARLDAGSPEELLRRLDDPADGQELLVRLVDEVAVKETYFLRNPDELARVDWLALLAGARGRGEDRVRVWCAACATGDEAYSLAILALEAFWPDPAPVEILATDIAPSALARARAGVYRERAVARLSPRQRARWLHDHHGGLRVGDAVRALVRFEPHNLVRDPLPPAGQRPFDLVTCRNVLIYFGSEDVDRAIAGLRGALAPGGELVLGAADRLSGARVLAGSAHEHGARDAAPARRPRPRARALRAMLHPAWAGGRPARGATPAPDPALDADVALGLGRAARARGDHGSAVRWLRRSLYLDPDRAVAALELSLAHHARGETGAERRALWTALRIAEAADGRESEQLAAEARSRLAVLDEPHGGLAS